MSTQPKTIDDINRTKTVVDGTERVPGRDGLGDFKITISNLIQSLESLYVGKEIKYFNSYIPISESFPWYCLSNADAVLDTTNYDTAFIDEMRSRKIIYNEITSPVSQFSGSWTGKVFTLDNNAANVAMITELYEDYLFNGSVGNAFRVITTSAGQEFYMIATTAINVSARTIEVTAGSNPTASTYIEVHLNRIVGSTTSCKHFSEAGLASYQAGVGKINGLRRRDKMQQITGNFPTILSVQGVGFGVGAFLDSSRDAGAFSTYGATNTQTLDLKFDSADSPSARTGPETQAKSSTDYKYVFVGSYTA